MAEQVKLVFMNNLNVSDEEEANVEKLLKSAAYVISETAAMLYTLQKADGNGITAREEADINFDDEHTPYTTPGWNIVMERRIHLAKSLISNAKHDRKFDAFLIYHSEEESQLFLDNLKVFAPQEAGTIGHLARNLAITVNYTKRTMTGKLMVYKNTDDQTTDSKALAAILLEDAFTFWKEMCRLSNSIKTDVALQKSFAAYAKCARKSGENEIDEDMANEFAIICELILLSRSKCAYWDSLISITPLLKKLYDCIDENTGQIKPRSKRVKGGFRNLPKSTRRRMEAES